MISLAFGWSGCPATTWDQLQNSKQVDELWAFVHHNPKDVNVPEAIRRIAYLEYQSAVSADTRYAYEVFLSRHPDSVHAFEVKTRLEQKDFQEASRRRTLEAIEEYLRTWPQGRYYTKAREIADELHCGALSQSNDPESIAAVLAANPAIHCRDLLARREEDLLFSRAMASGSTKKLTAFVLSHPTAEMASAARNAIIERQVEAWTNAARFERAVKTAQQHSDLSRREAIAEEIEDARFVWIRSSLDYQLIRKSAPGFDAARARSLREWANRIAGRWKSYKILAEAIAVLRGPPVEDPIGDTTVVDPRQRWLDAERLGLSPNEETAEFLLDLLGDSFLEVRRRALLSLRQVVASLGAVRAECWLAQKKSKLQPKATSGILLIKTAVLHELDGLLEEALRTQMEALESVDNPDPLALYCAVSAAQRLGKDSTAATLAFRLSDVLARFSKQRTEEWEGLRENDRGWLTLRQIYGVVELWRNVLAAYIPDGSGRPRLSAAEDLLGNWVERSRSNLEALEVWFAREEGWWSRQHGEYLASQAPGPDAPDMQQLAARELRALVLLATAHLSDCRVTVDWVAGWHPRPSTRLAAHLLPVVSHLIHQISW